MSSPFDVGALEDQYRRARDAAVSEAGARFERAEALHRAADLADTLAIALSYTDPAIADDWHARAEQHRAAARHPCTG